MVGRSVRCSLAASFAIIGLIDIFFLFIIGLRGKPLRPRRWFALFRRSPSPHPSTGRTSFVASTLSDLGDQSLVFRAQLRPFQQVRTVEQCLFQRLPSAPFADMVMVAGA